MMPSKRKHQTDSDFLSSMNYLDKKLDALIEMVDQYKARVDKFESKLDHIKQVCPEESPEAEDDEDEFPVKRCRSC